MYSKTFQLATEVMNFLRDLYCLQTLQESLILVC